MISFIIIFYGITIFMANPNSSSLLINPSTPTEKFQANANLLKNIHSKKFRFGFSISFPFYISIAA